MPTYDEVDRVRRAFFTDTLQPVLHIWPPRAEHVNVHPHCLHLWQPIAHNQVPDPKRERWLAVGGRLPERPVHGALVEHLAKADGE